MTPRFNTLLLSTLLLVGLPFYWFVIDNRPGEPVAKPVTIAQLRSLASSKPGKPPSAIQYEPVARTSRVRALNAAGRGLRPDKLFVFSYRLDFADKPPVLIDTGITAEHAKSKGFDRYYRQAQVRVVASLRSASHAILLASGSNHDGGLQSLATIDPDKAEAFSKVRRETPASNPYAITPGVVVIPTPDRQPGTRLVYVRLADGRDFLFLGDLAPTRWNIEEMRAPARLVTTYYQPANRDAIFAWLHTVKKLKRQSPGLTIISGNKVPKNRGLKRGFPSGKLRKQAGGNREAIGLGPQPEPLTAPYKAIVT